ncbi:MAG: hypothetical protein QNJ72_30170 [Pleurocapsa sp. MO_226.B13]|nr:hypothetical protein [Pleurocapsa sp. MO_226.B13]
MNSEPLINILINKILNQQDLSREISLSDRWLQDKLGKEHNLWQLSRRAWQNPWENRRLSKFKILTKLGLKNYGIGSSRLYIYNLNLSFNF